MNYWESRTLQLTFPKELQPHLMPSPVPQLCVPHSGVSFCPSPTLSCWAEGHTPVLLSPM